MKKGTAYSISITKTFVNGMISTGKAIFPDFQEVATVVTTNPIVPILASEVTFIHSLTPTKIGIYNFLINVGSQLTIYERFCNVLSLNEMFQASFFFSEEEATEYIKSWLFYLRDYLRDICNLKYEECDDSVASKIELAMFRVLSSTDGQLPTRNSRAIVSGIKKITSDTESIELDKGSSLYINSQEEELALQICYLVCPEKENIGSIPPPIIVEGSRRFEEDEQGGETFFSVTGGKSGDY